MSHFTLLVIGGNAKKQLKPYDESIQTEPRDTGPISFEDRQSMMDWYKKPENGGHELPFDELYELKGEDWNNNNWKKGDDGLWHEWTTYNEKSKWDWYELGGRWTGFFKLKEGLIGQVGKPGLQTKPAEIGRADVALKKEIDFEGMRKDAEDRAANSYDEAMKIFGKTKPNRTWSEVLEAYKDDIEGARDAYNGQERVKKWNETPDKPFGFFTSPDEFLISRSEYIENARNGAISTYAILKDGIWEERGEMGWFGMSRNEMDKKEWYKKINDLIDSLHPNTKLSLYDCHI